MEGRAGLSSHYNIVFRAPGLDRAHRHGPANMYWQIGSRGVTIVAPLDNGDLWAFGTSGVSESAMLSETQAIELIAATTGIDLPYEILQTDRWTASELLADKYQEGNIFIAGDAAHLHPPFGGFGMNMGIGDAVDLGWKIAATLQGWGGKRLLPSYEAERRPMAKAVIGEAMQNYAGMGKPPPLPAELADDSPQGEAVRARIGAVLRQSRAREFYTLGTVLGLPYTESPVIVGATQGAAQPHDGQNYVPNAAPGSLAPHAWLEDGRSLYDLFGSGFALLVQQGALEADIDAAEEDARRIGAPLAVVRLSTLSLDATYREPLYLIRPDQHVAWHGPRWSGAIFQAAGWPPDHEFKSNHGHRKDLRC